MKEKKRRVGRPSLNHRNYTELKREAKKRREKWVHIFENYSDFDFWVRERFPRVKEFFELNGISYSSYESWRRGVCSPKAKTFQKIVKATNGEINHVDQLRFKNVLREIKESEKKIM